MYSGAATEGAKGASPLNATNFGQFSYSAVFSLEMQRFFQWCREETSSLKMFECGFGLLDRSKDVWVV